MAWEREQNDVWEQSKFSVYLLRQSDHFWDAQFHVEVPQLAHQSVCNGYFGWNEWIDWTLWFDKVGSALPQQHFA
jgi:hypothetical protein